MASLEKTRSIVWSDSRLKSLICGRRYAYKYDQGALDLDTTDKIQPVQTAELAFGKAIHETIEQMHVAGMWNMDQWQKIFNRIWYIETKGVDWTRPGMKFKSTYEKNALKILFKYSVDNQDADVLQHEWEFPAKGEEFKIGPYPVRGKIDQIRRTEKGLVLLDFKTSAKEPDPLILRNDPQWTIYHKVASERFPGEHITVAYYHLLTGKIIYTERDEEDYKILEEMIGEAEERVAAAMFKRNLGFHCNYCDFKTHCLRPATATDTIINESIDTNSNT